jgi:hypothetical protein
LGSENPPPPKHLGADSLRSWAFRRLDVALPRLRHQIHPGACASTPSCSGSGGLSDPGTRSLHHRGRRWSSSTWLTHVSFSRLGLGGPSSARARSELPISHPGIVCIAGNSGLTWLCHAFATKFTQELAPPRPAAPAPADSPIRRILKRPDPQIRRPDPQIAVRHLLARTAGTSEHGPTHW